MTLHRQRAAAPCASEPGAESHALASAMLHLGEAYLLIGRMEEAHRLVERILALSRDHKERGHQAWALRLLGDIALCRRPPEVRQAEASYQQALADELGMRPLVAHCHLGLGKLYTRTGRRAEARAALSAAVELYGAMAMIFWLPQAEDVLAEVKSEAAANPTPCGAQQEQRCLAPHQGSHL